jgi:hypothetical protein
VAAIGPVEDPAELDAALAAAVRLLVDEAVPVLVDVVCARQ